MNLYDFDNTVYDGDTNKDIIKFFIFKYPSKVIKCLLKANKLKKEYKKGRVEFERVKEELFLFLSEIKDIDKLLNLFANKNMKKIKKWYLQNKNENDIIVTASYELWIKKFCDKLGVRYLIGTKIDSRGYIIGKNCKGEEKVLRIKYSLPSAIIKNAYSDSSSDIPMLKLAQNAFVVEGNKLIPYNDGYKFKNNK